VNGKTRVGVIGAGQLALMLAEAARTLDLELWVQTESLGDPAVGVADQVVPGIPDLVAHCDVVTFENEFVDLDVLGSLDRGTFYPRLSSLAPLLDKYTQRCFLRDLGIPVPAFSLTPPTWPLPWVWKQRRHSYDGLGTRLVHEPETWDLDQGMMEAYVPFERELAMMVARGHTGEIAFYPVVETVQINHVCDHVIAPALLSTDLEAQVHQISRRILEALDFIGMMGIELFLTPDEQILVNELAPRTHNSGHYTLDACATSQFAQHLRAITGLPLGSPDLTIPVALMVNLLGWETALSDYAPQRQHMASLPQTFVRWYGKRESRPGRKLGHVTTLLGHRQGIPAALHQIKSLWRSKEDSER